MFSISDLLSHAEAYVTSIGNELEGDAHNAIKKFLEFVHLANTPAPVAEPVAAPVEPVAPADGGGVPTPAGLPANE